MSREILEQVVARAVGDAAYRQLLRTEPTAALRGLGLTAQERAALTGGDPAKLVALGIDQRMSRAVIVGDDYMRAAHRDAPEGDVTAASRQFSPDLHVSSSVGRDTAGETGPGATEARIGEPPGGEFDASLVVTPAETAGQTHLRMIEEMLDVSGTVAGDSLPADAMGTVDSVEGLHRLREGAATEAAGIEGLQRLREGATTESAGIEGTFRLREGVEPAAGDSTPAGAMGPVDTDAQQESMTNVEWSKPEAVEEPPSDADLTEY